MAARAANRSRSRSERATAALRVRALSHEIGNLLAAVRLSAHLLETERGARQRRELARDQQRLVAHASSLLALVRPVVDPGVLSADALSLANVLEAARRAVDDCLPQGITLRVVKGARLPDVQADADVVHHVVVACLASAIEAARSRVSLRAGLEGRRVLLTIRDDGPPARGEGAQHGRHLLVGLVDGILRPLGGRARIEAAPRGTRVSLALRAAARR